MGALNSQKSEVNNYTVDKSGAVTPMASEDPYLIKDQQVLPAQLGSQINSRNASVGSMPDLQVKDPLQKLEMDDSAKKRTIDTTNVSQQHKAKSIKPSQSIKSLYGNETYQESKYQPGEIRLPKIPEKKVKKSLKQNASYHSLASGSSVHSQSLNTLSSYQQNQKNMFKRIRDENLRMGQLLLNTKPTVDVKKLQEHYDVKLGERREQIRKIKKLRYVVSTDKERNVSKASAMYRPLEPAQTLDESTEHQPKRSNDLVIRISNDRDSNIKQVMIPSISTKSLKKQPITNSQYISAKDRHMGSLSTLDQQRQSSNISLQYFKPTNQSKGTRFKRNNLPQRNRGSMDTSAIVEDSAMKFV